MMISDDFMTMTEANQNFSKVARQIDRDGDVVICKNNKPKYIVIDYDAIQKISNKNLTVKELTKRLLYKEQ